MLDQRTIGLRSQDNVDAVVRVLIGQHDNGDVEKVAVLGLGLKAGKSLFRWAVKSPGKAAVAGLVIVPSATAAYQKGKGAAIRPAGYHPISGYYLPQGRVQ